MLRLTFPVSSGSQHRKKEDELGLNPYGDWIAVEKKPKMMDPVAKPTTKIIPIPGITTMTSAEATVAAVGATLTATGRSHYLYSGLEFHLEHVERTRAFSFCKGHSH